MTPSLKVCICSNRHTPAQFTGALAMLMMTLNHRTPEGDFAFSKTGFYLQPFCSCLSNGRQNAVNMCVAEGYTHILFIDDDTVFPADAAHRLMRHGRAAVGVNFTAKQLPLRFQATDLRGNEVATWNGTPKGLQEVASLGFGFLMIETAVFKKIPQPHFDVTWTEHGYCAEDITCCKKIRAAGFPIFVDHDLSSECGHVGDYVYAPQRHQEVTL